MRKKNNKINDLNHKSSKNIKSEININEDKLKNEIVDLKSAVKINWKILNEYILSSIDTKDNDLNNNKNNPEENDNDKSEIEELLKSCKSLIESNIDVDEKIQKLKEENQEINDISEKYKFQIQKEYEKEKDKYSKLQVELTKKKARLNDVENTLLKTRAKSLFKESRNEVYVIEPTQKHLEMHQEILSTTDAIKNLEKLGREDNKKLNQLKKELEELQNEFNNTKEPVVPNPELPVSPGGPSGTPVVAELCSKNNIVPKHLDLNEP